MTPSNPLLHSEGRSGRKSEQIFPRSQSYFLSSSGGLAAAALSSHRLSAQTAGRTAEKRGDLIKVSQCVRDCPGAREVIQNADEVPLHHKDSYSTALKADSHQDSL